MRTKIRLSVILWVGVGLSIIVYFGAQKGLQSSASTVTQNPTIGQIMGKVTRNGEPLASAVVTAKAPISGSTQSTIADSGGNYALFSLESGDQTITANWQEQTTAKKIKISSNQPITVDLDIISKVGKITGKITNHGVKVEGAKVTATGGLYETAQTTQTDAEGNFNFSNVDVGAQTIEASWQDMKGNTQVTVSDGETAVANISISNQ